MTMYYEVNRYDNKITILRAVTKKEAEELGVRGLEINDCKINKFISNNIDNYVITIDSSGKIELGEETYFGIPLKEERKVEIAKKAKRKLDGIVKIPDLIYYIDFIDTNNILNSKGFFITDENKEEKYLEILETGNEDLIDTLERFLISKDRLSVVKTAREEFEEVIEKLKYAESDKELEEIESKI